MHPSVILIVILALSATPALAQVTIDLRALDAVKPPAPSQQKPAASHRQPAPKKQAAKTQKPAPETDRAPAASSAPAVQTPTAQTPTAQAPTAQAPAPSSASATPAPTTPAPASPATAAQGTSPSPASPAPAPATPAPATPPTATLPIVTPPGPTIAPIVPPVAATPPPVQAPVSSTATTTATPTASGMRLAFGAEETELSLAAVGEIKKFVAAAPAGEATSFNVVAYASAKSDDPSVSRRVSLSRALAVRATLIAEGVASSRIYVRALGAQAGSGPPDRVDVSLFGANAATPR